MKLKFFVIIVALFAILGLSACTSQSTNNDLTSNDPESSVDGPEPSENVEFDPNDKSNWPNSVRVGSASLGGTAYAYAGGYSSLIQKYTGVNSAVEVTGGPVHNIQLLQNQDIEIGVVTMGPAWEAWYGEGEWTGGQELRDWRVFFPMYTSYFHWWAKEDTGIRSIDDLNGKKVGVGPSGGTPATYLPEFLEILGVEAEPVYAGLGDLVSQQMDGLIPAVGFGGGIPFTSVQEAELQHKLNVFGFTEEQVSTLVSEYPFLSEAVIPANTYENQPDVMYSPSIWNLGVVQKDLPDSFVYQATDAVLSHNEELIQAHVAGEETLAENIKYNTFLWMHPGAIRWFEENGYDLPEEVYPPEYPKND
ncbi:TAXI family TRAP transporter solute-binding subunit [Halalkalibacter oceani]|uniref:TAXI family TRAP transporter solute-binding subunit n=1 Tax=Halalkalibacter oceani TaxID=1653776 RepID=UPI003397582A